MVDSGGMTINATLAVIAEFAHSCAFSGP